MKGYKNLEVPSLHPLLSFIRDVDLQSSVSQPFALSVTSATYFESILSLFRTADTVSLNQISNLNFFYF